MSDPIVKIVAAPLSVDQMKEAFLNKADRDSGKVKYVVDYAKSSIKGDVLLQYLSNLEISADFDFSGATKQDRFDFLHTYFKMKTIIKNNDLNEAASALLMFSKGFQPSFTTQTFLSEDEVKEFYQAHTELVNKWSHIVDSSVLLLLRACSPTTSLSEYAEVMDPSYCGLNFVNLYSIPGFFQAFTSAPSLKPLEWFTHHFETFAFNNDFLLRIMSEDKTITSAVGIMDAAVRGIFSQEDLKQIDQDLKALEGENVQHT